jgi:hypothetical protein
MEASVDLKLNSGNLWQDLGRIESEFKSRMDKMSGGSEGAKFAIKFRLENELKHLAQAEQSANDLAKAVDRIAQSNEKAASSAMKFRDAMQLQSRAFAEAEAKASEKKTAAGIAGGMITGRFRQEAELRAAAMAEAEERAAAKKTAAGAAGGAVTARFRAEADLRAAAIVEAEERARSKAEIAAEARRKSFRQAADMKDHTDRLHEIAAQRTTMVGAAMLTGGDPAQMAGVLAANTERAGLAAQRTGQNFRMMSIQASYGLQDLVTVMAGGGSFQQGMIAMSNNLGAMLTMTGDITGAVAGLGITLGALSIEPLYKWFTKTEDAAERLKQRAIELQREFARIDFKVGLGAGEAKLVADMRARQAQVGFAKGDAARLGMEFGEGKFANRNEDKELRNQIEQSKTSDAELQDRIAKNKDLRAKAAQEMQKHRDVLIRKEKFGQATGLPGAAAAMETANPFFFTGRAGVTTEMSKQEHDLQQKRFQSLHDQIEDDEASLKQNKRNRGILEAERNRITPDVMKEEDAAVQERLSKYERELSGKDETGNEFTNRRNRILFGHQEAQERINRETVGIPGWKRDLSAANQAHTDAAWKDVSRDEIHAQNRFMRGMESAQKGVGSVYAVQDKLSENLERATRLFGAGTPGEANAKAQAMETAKAENQRIMNANRPKGGQFFGLEQYSQHLMSQIAGGDPDEKAIRDNTFKAATTLDELLKKVGKGMGIWAK